MRGNRSRPDQAAAAQLYSVTSTIGRGWGGLIEQRETLSAPKVDSLSRVTEEKKHLLHCLIVFTLSFAILKTAITLPPAFEVS